MILTGPVRTPGLVLLDKQPELPIGGQAAYQARAARFTHRALEIVAPASHEAGRLLTRHAWDLGHLDGDYDGARQTLEQARAIAQREGDAALEVRTLVNTMELDFFQSRWQECVQNSRKTIEVARRVADAAAEMQSQVRAAFSLAIIGDLDGASSHARAGLLLAEQLRDSFWIETALLANETVFRLKGDWQAAREISDRGLVENRRDVRIMGMRALLEYETGNVEQGKAYLEMLSEPELLGRPGFRMGYVTTALVILMAGRITGVVERLESAKEIAETVLFAESASPSVTIVARGALVILGILLGGDAAVEEHYSALLSARRTMLPQGSPISVDRLLAGC